MTEEQQEDEQQEIKWVSGWDYVKEHHLGTMIFFAVIIGIVLYILYGIYFVDTSNQPDCYYENDGCQWDYSRFG